MVQGSNSGGDKIFCTCSDWPWDPPNLLYGGYQFFLGVKQLGHGIDYPPPSSIKVKERVGLYICSSHGLSWPSLG